MTEPTTSTATVDTAVVSVAPAGERGWGKLLLGLAAFLFLPNVPQFRALLPVDETMLLFVPALAACAVVGWWAGGRAMLAIAGIVVSAVLATQAPNANDSFHNLARGWTLVLAGAFGLVCLFGARRPFFPRSMMALGVSLALALIMSVLGPVSGSHMNRAVHDEFARRNSETMGTLNAFIGQYPKEWNEIVARIPQVGELPAETEKQLTALAQAGEGIFPSLLALESIVALAIAWSVYHRLSRARLGPPLTQLREFRFNDQFVWGLIIGLAIIFLPKLAFVRDLGRNLLVFFSAIYAVRGLGVLSWFTAPGTLAVTATVGFAMLWWPVLNAIAALGFLILGIAAFGLGLGDTWADWRNRPKTGTGD
ncbi:MAG: DUF2232 domain-containing protein [Gemmatimonadota bacterium]